MNDKPSILLINPPIYDFAAFDFWLKPLGMLTVAGKIAKQADFQIFDFLDRSHTFYLDKPQYKSDNWGRGKFFSIKIQKPDVLIKVPRYYRRFGLPAEIFTDFLKTNKPCDFAFIQTVMTYWYLGYQEVIRKLKKYWPRTKIILGGPYAMVCPQHAKNSGADFVLTENKPVKLWDFLNIEPDDSFLPLWDVYPHTYLNSYYEKIKSYEDTMLPNFYSADTKKTGVGVYGEIDPAPSDNSILNTRRCGIETAAMRITQGCPFKCTYCTVPLFCDGFSARPIEQAIEELKFLVSLGVKNIAFYDDALLYKSDEVLKPFLRYVIENKIDPAPSKYSQNWTERRCGVDISFHTPNALNARFIDEETAKLMVKAGFKSFYLGFESRAEEFQKQTGSKVFDNEFANAVKVLIAAGADISGITAYLMLGHPRFEIQEVEESMNFVNSLGVKIMLADFSPIPGTSDGKLAEKYVDMNEPLMHNKTAFPIILFGSEKVNRIKDIYRKLNHNLRNN